MTTKARTTAALIGAVAIAAAVAVILLLRAKPAEPKSPEEVRLAKLDEPSYREQVKVQVDDLKEIMLRIEATRREIAALGGDTNSERYAALTNRLAMQAAEVERNRLKGEAIVRERMKRDRDEAKQESLKQKGK